MAGAATRSMGAGLVAILAAAIHGAPVPASDFPDHDPAAGVGEFVEQLLDAFEVPGAAVVVVSDGEVVLASGYGVRSTMGADPVTKDTAFAISSLTKAFTSTAAAALVGDTTIHWQTRVAGLLPNLKLHDPITLEHATLADLLTHRTGIGRRMTIAMNASITLAELLEHLDLVEPDTEFRAGFTYSSMMYAVAGEMLARTAESSYEEVVTSRVLQPIGMTHTTFGPPTDSEAEVAAPHLPVDGAVMPTEPVDLSLFAAGSGLYSTADDMGRWLLFHLSDGRISDAEVAPPAALMPTHRPQIVMRSDGLPDAPILTYGMGWEVSVWKGHLRLGHGGGGSGFTAQIMLLPDEGVGVAVMTNSALNPIPDLVCERVALQTIGEPVPDRIGQARALIARMDEMRATQKARMRVRQDPDAPPSHPLEDYAGTYTHPLYGPVSVATEGSGLTMMFHELRFTVEHLHDEVFLIGHPLFDESPAEFISDSSGAVTELVIPFDNAPSPIPFEASRAKEVSPE